jgi:hypothetical protein
MKNTTNSAVAPKKTWVDANFVIESRTDAEIDEYLYGANSVHAKQTRQIEKINAMLAAKVGRPKKNSAEPANSDMGLCL